MEADVSDIQEHLAYQFNIIGEGSGIFYVEVKEGKLSVEPYEYYDRDAVVYVDAETLLDTLAGKVAVADVTSNGKLVIQGNYDATVKLLETLAA